MTEPIADDKFGKTRIHNGSQDSTTQYDIKKQKADLKKITASADQYTEEGGIGVHNPNWPEEDEEEPASILNAEKLALPANTPVGKRVQVTDGFVVSGLTGDFETANGLYVPDGTTNEGRPVYKSPNSVSGDCEYNSAFWFVGDQNAAPGNENFPWEADWSGTSIALTHPAVQELTAPSTAQGGVFVSGGTQDGIYSIGTDGLHNGRSYFKRLGDGNEDHLVIEWATDLNDSYGISAPGTPGWIFADVDTNLVYYSLSDVATPDLATNWKNASDDSPASITVTSVTQGELDAGVLVAGAGTSGVNSVITDKNVNAGRFDYGILVNVRWSGTTLWFISYDGTTEYQITDGGPFPWQGVCSVGGQDGTPPAPTVTRDDVASEANWSNVS